VSEQPTLAELVDGVRGGRRRAVARAISLVEDGDPLGYDLLRALYPDTGSAHIVGLTGSPGVGKSSVAAGLVRHLRGLDRRIGVVSVDPASPFTQGALLGDRIRLSDHFLDPEVFIRSMSTRGHLGGLSEATLEAALVLDAARYEVVLVETVGIGQSEVEVAHVADTVVLVLMPGAGDAVQALKAGVMEIPDVIAINKSDLDGARALVREVKAMLALGDLERPPPIVLTQARSGAGLDMLWDAIRAHRAWLGEDGRLVSRRARNLRAQVLSVATARAAAHLERVAASDPAVGAVLADVETRALDPLSAVRELLARVFRVGEAP
jgi:LAO/AO transport system kinase